MTEATMRVTITRTVMGEAGSLLTAGNTYAVSRSFGAYLVGQAKAATDTAGALTPKSSDPLRLQEGPGAVVATSDGSAPLNIAHPRYWFHGFAPTQSTDDAVFRDLVAGNNGAFGADLSKANAWANKAKGYISNVDPAGGVTDSVIRSPGPNFDYAGGQSLLIWWAGQATPEGSEQQCMGSANTSSTGGVAIRCPATGQLSFAMYGGGASLFSTTSTNNAAGKPFVSGEYHSFGIFIDGQNRQQSMWVDGQINVSALTLSSGSSCDTLSSNTWNIGTATPAGGTNGLAMNTLAFVGLKFLATDSLPTQAQITAALQALGRDPRGIILAGAL